ncbi:unnamed protein product [Vitrella brassicaformis CCMP3155]|uniref:Uncharacterized protein n=1 Tax=Vitrella brassicaformis (strain CCMP3155) TaxID=1169540 RepID=A0A0G4EC05_VITBC|nr:unnamed protein product [Vitrella brassicaformis CCMP3155]|eukprot:CEL92850.1 unnamed protein product [Vitrella brassicaformis CCMP3155]
MKAYLDSVAHVVECEESSDSLDGVSASSSDAADAERAEDVLSFPPTPFSSVRFPPPDCPPHIDMAPPALLAFELCFAANDKIKMHAVEVAPMSNPAHTVFAPPDSVEIEFWLESCNKQTPVVTQAVASFKADHACQMSCCAGDELVIHMRTTTQWTYATHATSRLSG